MMSIRQPNSQKKPGGNSGGDRRRRVASLDPRIRASERAQGGGPFQQRRRRARYRCRGGARPYVAGEGREHFFRYAQQLHRILIHALRARAPPDMALAVVRH